jgi:hypothetical protein
VKNAFSSAEMSGTGGHGRPPPPCRAHVSLYVQFDFLKSSVAYRSNQLECIQNCPSFSGDNALPDTCTCEDGETLDPSSLRPGNDNESGESDETPRRKLKKAFKECKPTKCQCPDGTEEIITFFGCAEGGIPSCQNDDSGPKKIKLVCDDGTRINPLKALLAQMKGKCVCEDGKTPKCKNGDLPTCPSGQEPDMTLAQVPDLLSGCV